MGLTHMDGRGRAAMVDVSGKKETERTAVAMGKVLMKKETIALILENKIAKGSVIETARIAGIMAAKKTSELIPLCHPLMVERVAVDVTPDEDNAQMHIKASVKVTGKTGVEMEALTAVSVAALTIYDMIKAVDREAAITDIFLAEKAGGKSGQFKRNEAK